MEFSVGTTRATKVTFTFTEEEAKRLLGVVGNIGGRGPTREMLDEIYRALYPAFAPCLNPFHGTPVLRDGA